MDPVFQQIIQAVLAVAAPALAGLLTALMIKLLARMGVALDDERRAQLARIATAAALRVEELAADYAKRNLSAWSGPEKLQAAVEEIVAKLPRVDRAEAEAAVRAALPGLALGATELGKELGKALRTR